MTTNDLSPSRSTTPLRGGSLAVRACIPGTVLSIVLVAAALFLVTAELRSYVVGGGLLAMVAGALGGFLQRSLMRERSRRLQLGYSVHPPSR